MLIKLVVKFFEGSFTVDVDLRVGCGSFPARTKFSDFGFFLLFEFNQSGLKRWDEVWYSPWTVLLGCPQYLVQLQFREGRKGEVLRQKRFDIARTGSQILRLRSLIEFAAEHKFGPWR